MIPEFGLLSLIIACLFSALLVTVPTVGLRMKNQAWIDAAPVYALGVGVFVVLAYVFLTLSFLKDDFTVLYVLSNSSTDLPWFYKLCAVWGGHEGSMLLWILMLSLWMCAVSIFKQALTPAVRTRSLIVLGGLSLGFLLFILLTSNPFLRQFSVLSPEGRDLNPLLQDPGFLFHPPMLYMGYVGFGIAFSLAIAALWLGPARSGNWTRWAAPWTLAAWSCLTIGITLGSWWAYRELGWGGWWFWDPVENASFMPWLVGTALFHSFLLNEKQKRFENWSMLLAIVTFSLSLIGTFLVRSGVLTSVHAFAVDPARGLFILGFLAVVMVSALTLFSVRAPAFKSKYPLHILSKEGTLLLNNLFLMVTMLTILMGTVYPLLIDGLGLGKLSVGAPYFNTMFIPLMLPFLGLMSVGIHVHWQQDSWLRLTKTLGLGLLISLLMILSILLWQRLQLSVYVVLALVLSLWIVWSTLQKVWMRFSKPGNRFSFAFWGMVVSHVGIAVTAMGIAVSSGYGLHRDVVLNKGDSVSISDYRLTLDASSPIKGPNYTGVRVAFVLQDSTQGKPTWLYPEKRIYNVGRMPMTESAIEATFFHDIYLALGEKQSNGAWSVRVYYKPLVRWIWGGGLLVALGGLLAILGRASQVFVTRRAT